jgi:hypothetical protein
MAMKASMIDPRKLLGFRVVHADAAANGHELDVSDSQLVQKVSAKIGEKPGNKPQID